LTNPYPKIKCRMEPAKLLLVEVFHKICIVKYCKKTPLIHYGEHMNQTEKSAKSRADFISSTGIGRELAEFVDAFIENPEQFNALTIDERCKFESQMDAILSSLG
jgi:hypothetical protein